LLRDVGQPFSSFGLVWKHLGRGTLRHDIPAHDIETVHARGSTPTLPIDLLDNCRESLCRWTALGHDPASLLETTSPSLTKGRMVAKHGRCAPNIARAFLKPRRPQRRELNADDAW
jgi:uncharacterized UPF0160 family protein